MFWRQFYPRFDAQPPEWDRLLLDSLAAERYKDQYIPREGIVRFASPQRLRVGGEVPSGRLADPHIAYFLKRNPRHSEGDELVCLTELTDDNLTMAGRRMVEGH